jgi:hypothetical protein
MKIGLITTLDTNIGDDFIREGIQRVLNRVFQGQAVEYASVNKHYPWTVFPKWHPVRHTDRFGGIPGVGPLIRNLLATGGRRLGGSAFHGSNLIVQCGAPVLWENCHRCEWAEPLWRGVVKDLHAQVPVLNLAAGSCYPWLRPPSAITDPGDARFLKEIASLCRATSVRDPLAHQLWNALGSRTEYIPCSASLAPDFPDQARPADEYIMVNYMPQGGHYAWGQGDFHSDWQTTAVTVLQRLGQRHRLLFVCHNAKETEEAKRLFPSHPSVQPKNPTEYFAHAVKAKAGLCNRLHASVALAGMGIPALSVGTDTRMLMLKPFGLPVRFVGEARAEEIEAEVESLIQSSAQHRERLLNLRRETDQAYFRLINEAIHRRA